MLVGSFGVSESNLSSFASRSCPHFFFPVVLLFSCFPTSFPTVPSCISHLWLCPSLLFPFCHLLQWPFNLVRNKLAWMHISCDYKHLFWSTSILLASWPSVTSNSSTSNKHEDKAGNVFFYWLCSTKYLLALKLRYGFPNLIKPQSCLRAWRDQANLCPLVWALGF